MLNSVTKHILHCCLLFIIIITFELISGGLSLNNDKKDLLDPWVEYGFVGAFVLYLLRTLTFLSFPQVLFNFVGLTIYNAFPDKVVLNGSPLLAPFICIRIVTRGDYPLLVKANVKRNLNKCIETGLENFQIEIVSDKPIGLPPHRRVREVVVPLNYRTSSGALFKARALQYCLENSVNELADNDWIVHLDEETLLTENSVRGILNFVLDGKHQFGQGLITYANEDVVNWITTLADSFRVADDMGKLRLQFTMFHKPYFSMKGSYVVTQMGAERQVSFNNGLDGSVAEDCFFAMKAFTQGYTFNFVDGEMWEKSPFTLWDFVQQRKRWLQAAYLLATLGGKTSPSQNDIEKILSSVGIESDGEKLRKVISQLNGKSIDELIAQGHEKLSSMLVGGAVAAGAAAAPAAGAAAAPAEEKKEEKKPAKEESESEDEDMGFGLFD
ncbi:Beta-1,4-mannosyltransferase egh [Dufourea novaeangliae]|uniref:Large ribosomal subunit protein P2 n=1 Tax=Dufourea novaeangliae TaxID=178035 RepID=A0A154PNH0_DUFNO|nr:Beta-1,4-mannosyltransferase egh [Dufourea novaeangliae]